MGAVRELAIEVRGKLETLQALMNKTDKVLFGNGQPGILVKVMEQVAAHEAFIRRFEGNKAGRAQQVKEVLQTVTIIGMLVKLLFYSR